MITHIVSENKSITTLFFTAVLYFKGQHITHRPFSPQTLQHNSSFLDAMSMGAVSSIQHYFLGGFHNEPGTRVGEKEVPVLL